VAFSARARGRICTFVLLLFALALCTIPAQAHVGSPDIYAEGKAGPYRLLVTIRPPQVIPGVAQIEVEEADPQAPEISSIEITPIPLTGEASKHPPVADQMKHSGKGASADVSFYTGSLWIMASGSWQVRFKVNGSWGEGVLSIPVPATSSSTRGMETGLGVMLSILGALLVAGVVGIVGAATREAQLAPGAAPAPGSRKRAWIAMAVTLAIMLAAVAGGKSWWDNEAGDYAKHVYKPLTMQATVDSNQTLHLSIEDPGWLKTRKTDDFVPDHDHLMHLYLIRQPGLDVVYHLHPDQVAPGKFDLALPSIPAGDYRLYADVVHATGFPETLVSELNLPETKGRALAGDDAKGTAAPLAGQIGPCAANPILGAQFRLPDGYTMVWNNPSTQPAKTPEVFEFSLLDAAGKPAPDMALYMGMVGHAAFVKDDGSVFAHVHPSGTVSMAALMMAAAQNQPGNAKKNAMVAMPDMEGMDSDEELVTSSQSGAKKVTKSPEMAVATKPAASEISSEVGFPYGFPTAGSYRVFVQMKHGQTVETAAFDACAAAPRAN
jgi:hypothetical protein